MTKKPIYEKEISSILYLPLHRLMISPFQPRKNFKQNELIGLASSIKQQGVLQPILVRKLNNNQYQIIAGERRWRAAQIAGLEVIPCIAQDFNDNDSMIAALIENIQRADLDHIEEAESYAKIIERNNYTHEELANILAKPRSHISNMLRLLNLAKEVTQLLKSGKISLGHAKILASMPESQQIDLAQKTIKNNLSVRQLEIQSKKDNINSSKEKNEEYLDSNVEYLQELLSEHLGCPSKIIYTKNGIGKIEIDFYSLDILQGILEQIGIIHD